jgi:hypothetical protein
VTKKYSYVVSLTVHTQTQNLVVSHFVESDTLIDSPKQISDIEKDVSARTGSPAAWNNHELLSSPKIRTRAREGHFFRYFVVYSYMLDGKTFSKNSYLYVPQHITTQNISSCQDILALKMKANVDDLQITFFKFEDEVLTES